MTVAERVKKMIGEYYQVDIAEITDDRVFKDDMLVIFITIRLGIPSYGVVGQEQTVAQLIAMFEEMAQLQTKTGRESDPLQ